MSVKLTHVSSFAMCVEKNRSATVLRVSLRTFYCWKYEGENCLRLKIGASCISLN